MSAGREAAAPSGAVVNVYCGTSPFAAAVLRALAASPHRPALVVTPPDRGRGRGRKRSPTPVAEAAGELGIEVHRTSSINREESLEAVFGVEPQALTVCAFGQLIGAELLERLEPLNVHPSLLPRWRGAAPIERAIMAGDERTGVCVMRLTAGLDEGPVGLREELPIDPGDDYGSLSERLAESGGDLLVRALGELAAGTLRWREQEAEGVTYAEKVGGEERRLDPSRIAAAEALRLRALTPHIGAYTVLASGERLGLREAAAVPAGPGPGEFAAVEEKLLLGCAEGALQIGSVQPSGGRWMSAADYLRGRGLPVVAAPATPG